MTDQQSGYAAEPADLLWTFVRRAENDPALILDNGARSASVALSSATVPKKGPAAAEAAQVLGMYHWLRYLVLPDEQAVDELALAIRYFTPFYRDFPECVPPLLHATMSKRLGATPKRVDSLLLYSYACDLLTSYHRTEQLHLLERAIRLLEDAAADPPSNVSDQLNILHNLGIALRLLYERTGDLGDAEEAVQVWREALAAVPSQYPDRANYLHGLAVSLQTLGDHTGGQSVLEEAVRVGREAVAATPEGHPKRADYLNDLGAALFALHLLCFEASVLSEAVQVGREVMAATPRDHPSYAGRLTNLGNALCELFTHTEKVSTLGEAARVSREAVVATTSDDPNRAMFLSNLGNILRQLYERTGQLSALEEAAQVGREAAALEPNSATLNNLGIALRELYERTGQLAALEDAVRFLREAVVVTPADHVDSAKQLDHLGEALQVLYECTGQLPLLEEAIQVGRKAVATARPDVPGYGARLTSLAEGLRLFSARTGELGALEEAIQLGRQAGSSTNLALSLRSWFIRTGDSGALEEAVQLGRNVVAASSHDDPARGLWLGNLGLFLGDLYGRAGELSVLEEAIQVGREAVAATPTESPDHALFLGNLGAALHTQYKRTGDPDALEEAIRAARESVAGTSETPVRLMNLNNLANSLRDLYKRTGDVAVLEEAVQLLREALAATVDGESSRVQRLHNLGNLLQQLYQRTDEASVLQEACRCYREVGDNPAGTTSLRIWSYRNYAHFSSDLDTPQSRLEALENAIDLLDSLAPGSLARVDREHHIGELRGLAGQAASAALTADQPERAVELLERTRGILAADTLGARGRDAARLRQKYPQLADEFEQLRIRLDILETTQDDNRDLAADRKDAHDAWRRLLDRIRNTPGFESFLEARPIEELAREAHEGPIVLVTTEHNRCDALILTSVPGRPVEVVPLDALTHEATVEQANRLLAARHTATDHRLDPAARAKAQQEIQAILAWLWDYVADPVLTHLGHTTSPGLDEQWPRVWWCPVGPLAFLPLHAAGHHVEEDPPPGQTGARTVLDRVISSYTTTVRALSHARARPSEPATPTTLLVPVADTPGALLPGVIDEAAAITELVPDAELLTRPTRETVLQALPNHHIAHFACHGHGDWGDPARSHLVLNDYTTAPLTIADISALNLTASLAYLSACDTNVTAPRLVDESLHITSAFHLAGYQHVIGTLWPINDRSAAQLATDFYDYLTNHGTTPPQTDRSAHALHHAVRRMRSQYPNSPTLWAANTHTGA